MGKLFRKTVLSVDLATCWEFFSSPENLSRITPAEMDFTITKFDGKKMYDGQVIEYSVKPLLGLSVKWVSQIRSVKDQREFADVQLSGPYKHWHHRHLFVEKEGKVEMIDIIHYKLPFGLLGKLAEKLIVRKKLNNIFDHRERTIQSLFKKVD